MKNITVTDEVYESLMKLGIIPTPPPPTPTWTPKAGKYRPYMDGVIVDTSMEDAALVIELIKLGVTRDTEDQCKQLHNKLINFARFDALVEECGGSKEFKPGESDNYYVYYDKRNKEWEIADLNWLYVPGIIYMTREVAERVIEKINKFNIKF